MSLKKFCSRMETQVVLALMFAIIAGMFFPQITPYVAWMGNLFMKLLKVFLAPLLFFSILTAVLGLGDLAKLGKIGTRTFAYYLATTTLAIGLSLIMMNVFQPGSGVDFKSFDSYESGEMQAITLTSFLLGLIPDNFFDAFVHMNAMQIVTLSIILGVFVISTVKTAKKLKDFQGLVDTINDAILGFIGFVVKLTPYGVFGIVTEVVAENGVQSMINLLPFCVIILFALAIHAFVSLPALGYALARFNAYEYFGKVREAILMGFSTSSSSATMPVSMRVAEKNAGLNKDVVNFTFPIGATVNMDGTALYQAAVAIFVAQVLGVDLSIIQQLTVVIIIIMASIGAAGVPGAGILILAVVFTSIGLPVEAIGIILAVDRILDMFRTGVNVWGDLLTAKVIDVYYEHSLEEKTLPEKMKGKILRKKIA